MTRWPRACGALVACALLAATTAAGATEIRDPVTGFRVDVEAAPGVCVIHPGAPLSPPCDGPEIAAVAASPAARHAGTLAVVRVAKSDAAPPWLLFVTAARGTFSASPTPENLEKVVSGAAATMRRADPSVRVHGARPSAPYDVIAPNGIQGVRFVGELDATGSSSTFVCLFLQSTAYQLVLGSPRADQEEAAAFVDRLLKTVSIEAPTARDLPAAPRPRAPRAAPTAVASADAAGPGGAETGRRIGEFAGALCVLGAAALLLHRLLRPRRGAAPGTSESAKKTVRRRRRGAP